MKFLDNINIKISLLYSVIIVVIGYILYLVGWEFPDTNILETLIFIGMSLIFVGIFSFIIFCLLGLSKI